MIDVPRLADWALALEASALPPATAERVRLQILAGLAAALDGVRLPNVAASRAAWGGPEPRPARKGAKAVKAPLDPEALAPWLATATVALDFDDYLLFAHAGHSAVNVALAAGLARDAELGAVTAAAAAADEIAARFGGLALLGPHNGQMWTHVHLAGSVIAAARLAGDSADVAARALGLAFSSPPFLLPPAFFGGSSKLLCAALPVRQGLLALRLARAAAGLAAPAAVFGSEDGLGKHFAHAPLDGFFEGLGEVWLADTLAVKRVPGCAYVSSVAEAAAEIARQFAASKGRLPQAADVERVDLSVTALTAAMEELARPHRPAALSAVEVNFSAPLTAALALLDGGLTPASLEEERLQRDTVELRAVAARVAVRHDMGRSLRLVDGVVRPLELADVLGDLRGEGARKVGWDLLRRYAGALRPGFGPATLDRSPLELLSESGAFSALRSVGQLVAGAVGRRRDGTRYSVARARPSEVRFAASAGLLAVLGGEVFEADCEVPPGAPGAAVGLHEVVRERLARAFRDARVEADPEAFVGTFLAAPVAAPLAELLAPVLPALGL